MHCCCCLTGTHDDRRDVAVCHACSCGVKDTANVGRRGCAAIELVVARPPLPVSDCPTTQQARCPQQQGGGGMELFLSYSVAMSEVGHEQQLLQQLREGEQSRYIWRLLSASLQGKGSPCRSHGFRCADVLIASVEEEVSDHVIKQLASAPRCLPSLLLLLLLLQQNMLTGTHHWIILYICTTLYLITQGNVFMFMPIGVLSIAFLLVLLMAHVRLRQHKKLKLVLPPRVQQAPGIPPPTPPTHTNA